MQPSIPYRISPGQTLAAERLSLHASMLRAPECLYRSRNVHERPSFCHQRERGHKLTRRTPSALSAGPIPRGPAPRTQKSPRRGRFAVCKGVWGREPGPAGALGERLTTRKGEGPQARINWKAQGRGAPRGGAPDEWLSRTGTRWRPRSRRPCAGPRRLRRPTLRSWRPIASSFRIFCPQRQSR